MPSELKKVYRKTPKFLDTQEIAVIILKFEWCGFNHRAVHPKDAGGIANSVDPDQTASLGAVWSGSALFAQTYLSENSGSLRLFFIPSVGKNPTCKLPCHHLVCVCIWKLISDS